MKSDLRKSILKKEVLFNKYRRCPLKANYTDERKQRNIVIRMENHSMRLYFYERCASGQKYKVFWLTVKPGYLGYGLIVLKCCAC